MPPYALTLGLHKCRCRHVIVPHMYSDPEKNPRGVSPSFGEKKRLCHPGRSRCWHWCGLVLLAVLGLTVWGCGYTLVGSPSAKPDRRTVAGEPFTNETREPQIEHAATAALRRALMQGRGFVLTSAAAAPTQLQGRVRRFRTTALSYGPNDNALAYRLEADIRVIVLNGEEPQPLLQHDIPARAEYLVPRSGDVREAAVARDAALARLARHFAERCAAWLTIALLEG